MKKENEDEVDKLLKKELEDPVNGAVYREDDWDAMEALLDRRKKRSGMVYWLPRLGSVAALMLLFLGLWLYKSPVKPGKGNNDQGQLSAVHPPKRDTGTSGGAAVQAAISSQEKIKKHDSYADNAVHPAQGKKNSSFLPLSAGGGRRRTTGNVITTKATDKKEVGTVDNHNYDGAIALNKQAVAPNPADKKEVSTIDAQKSNESIVSNSAAAAAATAAQPDKKEAGIIDGQNKSPENGMAANKSGAKVKKAGQSNSLNRAIFALTAVASTDMNGTGSLEGSKVGGNLGGLFSAKVNKWTFTTGVMYSIKPYEESFTTYRTSYKVKSPSSSSAVIAPSSSAVPVRLSSAETPPPPPSSVGVNCRMLDIPLNVNYRVYGNQNNRISVGTGLSSYIILREDYTFYYDDPNAAPKSRTVINENKNIFGILNLDATYERQVNSKFSIAVQPYLKLPFSNVGASQVKLQSAGVAVGVSWNLNH